MSGEIGAEYLCGSGGVQDFEQILLTVAENDVFHGSVVAVALHLVGGSYTDLGGGDLRQGELLLFLEAQIIVHHADFVLLQLYVSFRHILRHEPKEGKHAGEEQNQKQCQDNASSRNQTQTRRSEEKYV